MSDNITRKYALTLIRRGEACFGKLCHDSDGSVWVEVLQMPEFGNRLWFCRATKTQASQYRSR